MELIDRYKDNITNRIKIKCNELHKRISDENTEFENDFIQLNIDYFKKYSEIMNNTNYDVNFYIESWYGFGNLLTLVYKNFFDRVFNGINGETSRILRNVKYNSEEHISVDEYIHSDAFHDTMHNYVDAFALTGLINVHIIVDKLFIETQNLKELYNIQLTEDYPAVVAFMIDDEYPIYYCSKYQAEAIEGLLGRQSLFDKLLRTS